LPKNLPNSKNSTDANVSVIKSRLPIAPKPNGRIVAEQPSTKKTLTIQLPITLPIAKPGLPFMAAVTEVANSGSDEPKAAIVNPIMVSLTPRLFANSLAASTKKSPPTTNNANPPML
jgi:hypothetical protein